jgi:hypothetical protein
MSLTYSFLGPRGEIELRFSHTHKKPRIHFVTKLQLQYSQKHFIGVLMSVTQEAIVSIPMRRSVLSGCMQWDTNRTVLRE